MIVLNTKIEVAGKPSISARELHRALATYPGGFTGWIGYRLKTQKLVEGVDYSTSIDKANYFQKDYHLTVQAALKLARNSHYTTMNTVVGLLETLLAPDEVVAPVVASAKVAVFSPPAALSGVKTMSSVEIVEVINAMREPGRAELAHRTFMEKVRNHPGIAAQNFLHSYLGGNGKQEPCYYLPKREAELMVMSESLAVQTQVYDRLAVLEAKSAPVVLAPPTTYLEALKQLIANVEVQEKQALQITQQAVQIEAAAPAVQFVEKYVDSEGLKTFRQVAGLLDANEREFRNFLMDRKYMQKINGSYQAHYSHKVAGRLVNKESVVDGTVRFRCFFTPKGVEYVTRKWNERVPVLRKPIVTPKGGY